MVRASLWFFFGRYFGERWSKITFLMVKQKTWEPKNLGVFLLHHFVWGLATGFEVDQDCPHVFLYLSRCFFHLKDSSIWIWKFTSFVYFPPKKNSDYFHSSRFFLASHCGRVDTSHRAGGKPLPNNPQRLHLNLTGTPFWVQPDLVFHHFFLLKF